MSTCKSKSKSPLTFFILVYTLTIPFWILSTFLKAEGLPDNLPITDVGATFMPLLAALILVFREEKMHGVKQLLKRTFDYKRIKEKIWYIPIICLMPFLYVLAYGIMHLLDLPLPNAWYIPPLTPLIFVGFFIAAAGEELGYMGYAIDPMQEKRSSLAACLLMGSVHALWHYPSMIQLGQSPLLMISGTLFTIGMRVLFVWLYNNTGRSVFAAILFHAIGNTGRTIFPGGRSGFELADALVGYSLVVIAAIVVIFLWGPKTLARFRFRPADR